MKFKINREHLGAKLVSSHRKEKPLDWDGAKIIATDGISIVEAMDIRCYHTKSRCYACVWLNIPHDRETMLPFSRASGSAWASGYGYDRQDAAIHGALEAMGFAFESLEWSPGQGIWEKSCKEIVRELYPHGTLIKTIKVHS